MFASMLRWFKRNPRESALPYVQVFARGDKILVHPLDCVSGGPYVAAEPFQAYDATLSDAELGAAVLQHMALSAVRPKMPDDMSYLKKRQAVFGARSEKQFCQSTRMVSVTVSAAGVVISPYRVEGNGFVGLVDCKIALDNRVDAAQLGASVRAGLRACVV